jgi:hypothetical protein
MHGECLRLLSLQDHRETEEHFTATRVPSQHNSDKFRFRLAAFYQHLKSKVGLAAAKAAALRISLNIDGCGVIAPPVHAPREDDEQLCNRSCSKVINNNNIWGPRRDLRPRPAIIAGKRGQGPAEMPGAG